MHAIAWRCTEFMAYLVSSYMRCLGWAGLCVRFWCTFNPIYLLHGLLEYFVLFFDLVWWVVAPRRQGAAKNARTQRAATHNIPKNHIKIMRIKFIQFKYLIANTFKLFGAMPFSPRSWPCSHHMYIVQTTNKVVSSPTHIDCVCVHSFHLGSALFVVLYGTTSITQKCMHFCDDENNKRDEHGATKMKTTNNNKLLRKEKKEVHQSMLSERWWDEEWRGRGEKRETARARNESKNDIKLKTIIE